LATFQMMMNEIYKDIIEKHEKVGTTICVYMDNIGIATRTNLIDHTNTVKNVLEVAMNYDLYFKLEKCTFHSPSLVYLGVILEKGVCYVTVGTFTRRGLSSSVRKLEKSKVEFGLRVSSSK
jgi:Reverse transcriptase (RNA-dependent DNA polymerase)